MKKISTDPSVRIDIDARPDRVFTKTFNINNPDGTLFDFTGYTGKMLLRKFQGDEPILTLEEGSGFTLSEGLISFLKSDEDFTLARHKYLYEIILDGGAGDVTWINGIVDVNDKVKDSTDQTETLTISLSGEEVTITIQTGETAASIKSKYDSLGISDFTPVNEITFDKDKLGTLQSGGAWSFTKAATGNLNGKTVSMLLNTPDSVAFSSDFVALDSTTADITKLVHIFSYYNAELDKAYYAVKNTTALDLTTPTIESATVEDAADTSLVVVFSEVVTVTDTTGLTLSFTTGTAKTLTGVIVGSGTNTLTFTISAAIEEGDVFTLEVSADNNIIDGGGNGLAATSHEVTNNVTVEFTPLSLDPYIWQEARSIDSADTVNEVRDTGAQLFVKQYDDKGTNSRNWLQATDADQPELLSDETDAAYLQFGATAGTKVMTLPATPVVFQQSFELFFYGDIDDASSLQVLIEEPLSASQGISIYITSGSLTVRLINAVETRANTGSVITTGKTLLNIEVNFEDQKIRIRKDGVLLAYGTETGDLPVIDPMTNNFDEPISLMNRDGSSINFRGKHRAFLMTRKLTPTERTNIESYFTY